MNNTEKNKLIAEFMGYPSYEFRGHTMFVYEEDNHRAASDLYYHDSWDWLTPVIEKIERENLEHYFGVLRISTNILRTYEGVVELIKLNNESNFNQ